MIRFIILIFSINLFSMPAYSQALTILNGAVNNAFIKYAARRGFAANDPRFAQVVQNSSSVIASNITPTASGFSTLGWSLGQFINILKLDGGDDTIYSDKFQFSISDGKGYYNYKPTPNYPPPAAISSNPNAQIDYLVRAEGNYARTFSTNGSSVFPIRPTELENRAPYPYSMSLIDNHVTYFSDLASMGSVFKDYVSKVWRPGDTTNFNIQFFHQGTDLQLRYSGTNYDSYGNPRPFDYQVNAENITEIQNLFNDRSLGPAVQLYKRMAVNDASQLTTYDYSYDIDGDLLARYANNLYNASSSLSTGTLPYDLYDPITPSDFSDPVKFGHLLDTATSYVAPISPAPPPVGPGTDVRIVNVPTVNIANWDYLIGINPNMSAPVLADYPIASKIFEPFLQLVKPLINFTQVSIPSGTCPKPEFNLFSKSIIMTQHCELFEQNRQVIQSIMSIVFAIAALLIVFSA